MITPKLTHIQAEKLLHQVGRGEKKTNVTTGQASRGNEETSVATRGKSKKFVATHGPLQILRVRNEFLCKLQ